MNDEEFKKEQTRQLDYMVNSIRYNELKKLGKKLGICTLIFILASLVTQSFLIGLASASLGMNMKYLIDKLSDIKNVRKQFESLNVTFLANDATEDTIKKTLEVAQKTNEEEDK